MEQVLQRAAIWMKRHALALTARVIGFLFERRFYGNWHSQMV
jgi:hypothetical protein